MNACCVQIILILFRTSSAASTHCIAKFTHYDIR